MAKIQEIKEPTPITISKFLGINLEQDTQISTGESANMTNCYITSEYGLAKAYGYLQMSNAIASSNVMGLWFGKVAGTEIFLVACNGHLYKINDGEWENFLSTEDFVDISTDLGTLTDAKTRFFDFDDKVYILNGSEYKVYDGTTLADVSGYIPKTLIGCTPSTGAGTKYELLNLLTGSKRLTYDGDATATYQLPETDIDSVDSVEVDTITQTVTTDYTVNLTTGVITFTAGNFPSTGLDNVEIQYTKGTGNRDEVYKNRFAFKFGQSTDNRVFLYGNPNYKNKILFSPLADGVPSAEYFTAYGSIEVGSANEYVTGLRSTQGKLIISKPTETYYSYYDSVDLDGVTVVNFPTTIINDSRGNVPMGQTQVLSNEVYSIDRQLLKWYPTENKNEQNQKDMGSRIQKDLDNINISEILTIDREKTSEMFMSFEKNIWIYNYGLYKSYKTYNSSSSTSYSSQQGIFSKLILKDTPTCWVVINGNLFFGTTDGKIMKMSEDYLTYNGEAIEAHWENNMSDFGSAWQDKTLNKSWVVVSAQSKVALTIQYVTDKNAYGKTKDITYDLATFDDVDFGNFTFYTNYNPQVFYVRLKAKKFKYAKAVIDNNSLTSTFNLLELTMKAEYGNEVK